MEASSGEASSGEASIAGRPLLLNRLEGAFVTGLFKKKSTIASRKPLVSSATSPILKQTDIEVSACHIRAHTAQCTRDGVWVGAVHGVEKHTRVRF